jgi:hypothetical protein
MARALGFTLIPTRGIMAVVVVTTVPPHHLPCIRRYISHVLSSSVLQVCSGRFVHHILDRVVYLASLTMTKNPDTINAEKTATTSQAAEDGIAAVNPEPAAPEVAYTVFSHRLKVFIIVMSAISSLFSPVSTLIYIPALDVLADFYHVSIGRINLSVTTFQILQGLAPMFFGDMADQTGRRPVYILTLSIYLIANIALALQSNYAALLVLRALQSTGSSGTIALGTAVMADIATPAERSGYSE